MSENEKTNEQADRSAGEEAGSNILVSVSCITFNHGRYLREALESFLFQKRDFEIEILIHDDCSTDDTIAILKEYEEKYPALFKVMYEAENQYSKGITNPSGVFNFPRARGKYIAMCEGDDFWTDPEKLMKQVRYMEAHPECAMCCHAADILFEDEAYRSGSEIRPFEETLELHAERVIAKKTNFPTASLFFRTEYAKTLPDWYFSCPVGDIPLHLYMASKGTVCYMDEKMSMYRQGREGSWGAEMDSADAHRKWERHFIEMRAMYMSFDADTGLRYHDSVNLALDRSRFLIDLKEGNMKVVQKPENRRFLEELPKMERQLLMLRARLPFVYDLIRRSYLLLKGRT